MAESDSLAALARGLDSCSGGAVLAIIAAQLYHAVTMRSESRMIS